MHTFIARICAEATAVEGDWHSPLLLVLLKPQDPLGRVSRSHSKSGARLHNSLSTAKKKRDAVVEQSCCVSAGGLSD